MVVISRRPATTSGKNRTVVVIGVLSDCVLVGYGVETFRARRGKVGPP